MKRLVCALAGIAFATLAPALPAAAFTPATTEATHALTWLHSQQAADGTIAASASRTEDTVLGLVANGQSVSDFATAGKTPIDSLRSNIAGEEKTAGNIGGLIMAVAAAGLNPTAFAGRNLLQDLACTYDPATGAYNPQVFNDALAVLALPADSAPPKAISFLADRQQPDGGWEFSPSYGSDTNTTAIVVLALESANSLTAVEKAAAIVYFKSQQKPTGGFEYATGSPDSDPNSDAAVIQGLLAMDEDPSGSAWTIAGKNAISDLISFQFDNGGFGFLRPGSSSTAAPDPLSTTQSLVALASRYLPVTRTAGPMPVTCPSASPTASPTTPSSGTGTGTLAQTGASPLVPLSGGLLLVVLGWRMRPRRVH